MGRISKIHMSMIVNEETKGKVIYLMRKSDRIIAVKLIKVKKYWMQ